MFYGQICDYSGIDQHISTTFHPQLNLLTERMNASIEQFLRVLFSYQLDDSGQRHLLPEFAANNGMSDSIGFTPIFAVQRTDPQMSFSAEQTKQHDPCA